MAVRVERDSVALTPLRTVALAIGSVCAISASVTLLMTEDSKYLRIAILVAVWGFVLAALAASRRQTDQAMAAGTDIELRRGYELELEREVAARREYELALEVRLRRELQDDFAAQVGALREEMSSLRRELSEQWDSELRVERMVMRTQSVRLGTDRRDSIEADPARPYIDAVRGVSGPVGGPTSPAVAAEPASYEPAPADRASPELVSYEPMSYEPVSYEPSYERPSYERPSYEPASPEPPSYQPLSYERPSYESHSYEDRPYLEPAGSPRFDAAAATSEFAAVTSEFPAVTNNGPPPVPSARPSWSSSPPLPDYAAQTPAQPDPEDDDVLTRVLAEAGGSARGRRRKHRYADEDEDGGPVGF